MTAVVKADLNPRQLAFCREYAVDHNGTQAAIRAGYTPSGAEVQAVRLLKDDRVRAEIARLDARTAQAVGLQAESVLAEISALAHARLTDIVVFGTRDVTVGFDDDGKAVPVERLHDAVRVERQTVNFVEAKVSSSDDLPDAAKAAIASVKINGQGQLEVRMHDKNAALDKAGRCLGLFKPTDLNLSFTLEDLVRAAIAGG